MRITLKTSGGIAHFPGLAAGRTIDVDQLPADRRDALGALLDSSHFFELPGRLAARPGAADYQTHTITVSEAGRHHTVAVSDPVPANLEPLLNFLREITEKRSD